MSMIPYLNDIERPFRLMEREFNQLLPREFGPAFKPWENIIKPVEQLSSAINELALNEMRNITADNEKFQVSVDVQHFSPNEISVKVIDRHVVVEGKHEEKQDQHGFVSRQFVRRYALPEGCLPDTVESKLSSDGVLIVTAPRVLALPSTGERIVPIKQTGPIQKKIGSPLIEN